MSKPNKVRFLPISELNIIRRLWCSPRKSTWHLYSLIERLQDLGTGSCVIDFPHKSKCMPFLKNQICRREMFH